MCVSVCRCASVGVYACVCVCLSICLYTDSLQWWISVNNIACMCKCVYFLVTVCSLQLREWLFEQEKNLLQSQNNWLNSELNIKTEKLLNLQKHRVSCVLQV